MVVRKGESSYHPRTNLRQVPNSCGAGRILRQAQDKFIKGVFPDELAFAYMYSDYGKLGKNCSC